MKVTVAKNAGFCFGVKRATDRLEDALRAAKKGETVYTLGHLIHNETYNESLRQRGVQVATEADMAQIAQTASADHPATILVRAHGCSKQIQEQLEFYANENPHFHWIDCTCPYVKKIHKIAQENSAPDRFFILIGAETHPEVIGIMSYFDGEKYVYPNADALDEAVPSLEAVKMNKKTPVMAAQTTLNLANWNQSQKNLKNHCTNCVIFDTICSVTELRQSEADALSQECDFIVVIGGRESSNTAKLYEICRRNCRKAL